METCFRIKYPVIMAEMETLRKIVFTLISDEMTVDGINLNLYKSRIRCHDDSFAYGIRLCMVKRCKWQHN